MLFLVIATVALLVSALLSIAVLVYADTALETLSTGKVNNSVAIVGLLAACAAISYIVHY